MTSRTPGVRWTVEHLQFGEGRPVPGDPEARVTVLAGWPIHVLRREEVHTTPRLPPGVFRIHPEYTDPSELWERLHAYRPMWPRAIATFVIVGAASWTLMAVGASVIGQVRLRKGRCFCGYDWVGLTTCPECGRSRSHTR